MVTLSRTRAAYLSVSLQHIDLDRGARAVLRDISWRIEPGQRWVLTGDNGAGKTQLLKLIAGAVWPTPTGRERRRYRWRAEHFDSPAGVAEEIAYVGAERQDRYERYDWNFRVREVVGTGAQRTDIPMGALSPRAQRTVAICLRKLDIEALAERRFLTLSYGERRLTLIARALASAPRLLLLDEVANGLDERNHARVMRWLAGTGRSAMPWVFATHRADDVPAVATHELLLRRGRVVRAGRANAEALRARLATAAKPLPGVALARRAGRRVLVSLRRADVHVDDVRVLADLDLTIASGECWVVHGPNGSGKSTLLRTLYGDHAVAAGGSIARHGIVAGVPLERFKMRTALVAPHLQSVHAPHTPVLEVVASGRYASIGLNEKISAADRRAAEGALRRFGMYAARHRTIAELSYGQMRRVLFARAWVGRPRLALLDEPFAGLDPRTRVDLMRRLDEWLAAGGSCAIATHHRSEWPMHATHELELAAGRCVAIRRLAGT